MKVLPSGTAVYVYDSLRPVSLRVGEWASRRHPVRYSVRLVTDAQANVVARYDYAWLGQEIPAGVGGPTNFWAASDSVNQKFTGYERDGETSLDFAQARYMSSGLGRFMSSDPGNAGADFANPQSWNAYAYVLGNPLGNVDPSGMDCEDVPGGGTCVSLGLIQITVRNPCWWSIFCGGGSPSTAIPDLNDILAIWLAAPSRGGRGTSSASGGGATTATSASAATAASPAPKPSAPKVTRIGNFPTLDCDGYRAARSILPQSEKRGIEFGGFLYRNGNGRYSYSNSVAGTQTSVPTLFSSPQALVSRIAGWFHSHPLVPGYNNEMFSGSDLLPARYLKGPGYLAAADSTILKLSLDPRGFPQVSTVSSGSCQVP